ncbi:MAG: acyl-CoA dehydrogenase family protein [Ardenticatenaceae bacterium]|nr:acyl-CoA dehydrogenase family protein [Ardenticatenaceae bacterium]HBY98002.1 acyl-CoA dehydrogenase [Chloroflexota bacterium]
MDFRLSEDQVLFQQTVRDFVQHEVAPVARAIDEQDTFPIELFRRCGRLGFFSLRYPEDVGGAGADGLTFILMVEELARGSLALASIVGMQALNGTDILYHLGTPEQKERLLVPALAGEKIATIAITESDAGSDIGGITTRADRVLDGWSLNGRKMWITSADVADFFIVAAKTEPEQRTKGIDLFLVERNMPGVARGRKIEKLGTRGSLTSELVLDNVRVPPENLLGAQGSGFQHLRSTLAEIRAMTAALGLGLGQAALDAALQYAQVRSQFGRPIGKFQAIAHKLAAMATQLEATRWLVYRAAWGISAGEPDMRLAAMAKLYASEMANELADEATRIFGSYGFAMEYDAQRYFRDARFLLYGAGTSEILLSLIAKQLGL